MWKAHLQLTVHEISQQKKPQVPGGRKPEKSAQLTTSLPNICSEWLKAVTTTSKLGHFAVAEHWKAPALPCELAFGPRLPLAFSTEVYESEDDIDLES